ncbi:MAG: PD-(D/E)XK nuclease family protein [Bacteroidales bacterium]|nr:PD-(D/E)XK nuclease family protein [Bacteroidales bacterium]
MSTFLSKLVDECISHKLINPDTIIVLPNQRARKMLLRELQQREELPKPLFLPEILSIENFLEFLSPLRKAEPLELLGALYEVYSPKVMREDKLDDFMRWADTFIKDLSDMEMQMQQVGHILRDVAQSKNFEFRIGQEDISKGQQSTIQFYQLLEELYVDFNRLLLQKRTAYPGLLYRDCAENIAQYAQALQCKNIVFAGLYVLSISEQQIVKHLKDTFNTHFYFDFDPFYCDFDQEPLFSTSYFLKEVCTTLSLNTQNLHFKGTEYETIDKKVEVVGAMGQINQVFYAVDCLQKLDKEELDQTVVVLADESMLLPFAKAFDTSAANVTMGVSFTQTRTYQLIYDLLDLYQYGYVQVQDHPDRPIPWFHPVLERVLDNPLLQCTLPDDAKCAMMKDWKRLLQQPNVYFGPDTADLSSVLPSFTGQTCGMLAAMVQYLVSLRDSLSSKSSYYPSVSMSIETLQKVSDFLHSVDGDAVSFPVLRNLILKQIEAVTMPLEGDATKGLQVMGLLETRALDFKNVIMLGANERVLPRPVQYNSLLPFDYKYDAAIFPNYIYKDKITAYHFFRLLQRAEHVTLLYNTSSQHSLAEPSRFISQLEFEKTKRGLDNIVIQKLTVSPTIQSNMRPIAVHNNDQIISKLSDYSFSATSLSDYVRCPLKFYLKHICKLRGEEDNVLAFNSIGTIVHKVFQQVFQEAKNQKSAYVFLQKLSSDETEQDCKWIIPAILEETMVGEKDLETGRYLLLTEMVKKHVKAYLERAPKEFEDGDVTLLSLEESVSCKYPCGTASPSGFIYLNGTIDRLQKKGSHLMILDYKTGSVDEKKLRIKPEDVAKVFQKPDYDKLLQLFVYAVLCKHAAGGLIAEERSRGISDPVCGIISTKECLKNRNSSGLFTMIYDQGQHHFDDVVMTQFETSFQEMIARIFDPDGVFCQTTDEHKCSYCDFKNLCRR